MNNRLTQIIASKRKEVDLLKEEKKLSDFEASSYFARKGKSLRSILEKQPGIIAEFKRASPSEGTIHENAKVQSIVKGYDKAGAVAVSVLTDKEFFGGSGGDLVQARQITDLPLLRKDFILDEIQLFEAKSLGADIVLLIGEILEKEEVAHLANVAKAIQLEVLFEIHSESQLEKLTSDIDFVGVNNRDLTTFEVDVQQSIDLSSKIPNEFIKISESGFTQAEEIMRVQAADYRAFLIGSHFMRQEDPPVALQSLLSSLGTKHV